jgi:hypothetical protein
MKERRNALAIMRATAALLHVTAADPTANNGVCANPASEECKSSSSLATPTPLPMPELGEVWPALLGLEPTAADDWMYTIYRRTWEYRPAGTAGTTKTVRVALSLEAVLSEA